MIPFLDKTRTRDIYLNEIDNTRVQLTDVDSRLAVLEGAPVSSGSVDAIQENDPFPSTMIQSFNTDCVTYLDFSNPDKVSRDVGPNQIEPVNTGVVYQSDSERTHSVYLEQKSLLTADENLYNNSNATLNFTSATSEFAIAAYSMSFWFKVDPIDPDINYYTIFSGSENLTDGNTTAVSHLNIHAYVNGATKILAVNYKAGTWIVQTETAISFDTWYHVAFINDATGHKIYLNGSAIDGGDYATGDDTANINITAFDQFAVGAFLGSDTAAGLTRHGFCGQLSDFSFWSRKLSADEVAMLSADDYGYCCYLLTGQSNMVGYGSDYDASDEDFSTYQQGRVYEFKTRDNANTSSPYAVAYEDPAAVSNNLNHPTASADKTGLWKTYADDLIQYAPLPWRKKVCLIPVAYGGKGFSDYFGVASNNEGTLTCINACNAVLDPAVNVKNNMNVYAGLLWNQGEAEINAANDDYATPFNAMIAKFSTDIPGFTDKPIVMAEICGTKWDTFLISGARHKDLINSQFQEIADASDNISLVKTVGTTLNHQDAVHYTSESYRLLGSMYYDAYCKAAGISNLKPRADSAMVVGYKALSSGIKFTKPVASIAFTNGIYPPAHSTYTNIPISGYFSYTWDTVSASGVTEPIDEHPCIFHFTKLGNICFFTLPAQIFFTATRTGRLKYENIPAEFRPVYKYNTLGQCRVQTGGVSTLCDIDIETDGTLVISINEAAKNGSATDGTENAPSFTSGKEITIYGFSISYISS